MAAAKVLGVRQVSFLDYMDGDLDQADPIEAVAKIVGHLRRVRPQAVITFGPEGVYGHSDHIANSQFTTAAVVCAVDPNYPRSSESEAQGVSKLYYMVATKDEIAAYQSVFGDLVMHVDGTERRAAGWEDWAVTTGIDTEAHWRTAWQAVACHQTQLPGYRALESLPEEQHKSLWGRPTYYRVFSLVNGGRTVERDLFEGLH